MGVEELPLMSQFSLEALRRYLKTYPETAQQIALDTFEDYLRELHRSHRLQAENAALKAQLTTNPKPSPQLFPVSR